MTRKMKKAFTLVELVIVIAVIAILAAVLIPTFTSLINKANETYDVSLVKNMNSILSTTYGEEVPVSMGEVVDLMDENGYNLASINPRADGYLIGWDETSNKMLYIDQDDKISYSATEGLSTIKPLSNGLTTLAVDIETVNANTVEEIDKSTIWLAISAQNVELAERGYNCYLDELLDETINVVAKKIEFGSQNQVVTISWQKSENDAVVLFECSGISSGVFVQDDENSVVLDNTNSNSVAISNSDGLQSLISSTTINDVCIELLENIELNEILTIPALSNITIDLYQNNLELNKNILNYGNLTIVDSLADSSIYENYEYNVNDSFEDCEAGVVFMNNSTIKMSSTSEAVLNIEGGVFYSDNSTILDIEENNVCYITNGLLISKDRLDDVISLEDYGKIYISGGNLCGYTAIMSQGASSIYIDNCTIQSACGIYHSSVGDLYLENVVIDSSIEYAYELISGTTDIVGVTIYSSQNEPDDIERDYAVVSILNCTISVLNGDDTNGAQGICLYQTNSQTTIDNCEVFVSQKEGTSSSDVLYGIYQRKGIVSIIGGKFEGQLSIQITTGELDIKDSEFISYEYSGMEVRGGDVYMENVTANGASCGIFMDNGELSINGGTYTGNGYSGIEVGGGVVTINGGEFNGNTCGIYMGDGQLTINGGSFTGKDYSAIEVSNGVVCIYDGVFIDTNGGIYKDSGSLTIYGGSYAYNPSSFLSDEYKAEKDEDGMWIVSLK